MTRLIATVLGFLLCTLSNLALAEEVKTITLCYTGSTIGVLAPCPS